MRRGLAITLAVVAVLLLAVVVVFFSYQDSRNHMVSLDQAVKTNWSDVDVQLERRADLIPNLVATVKGFTKEESSVFTEIAQARDGLMNAQTPEAKIAANGQLDSALAKVLVLTENYPTLRSSDQFMRLQDELSGTENRIAVARNRYNQALQDYNTYIQQFPNNIWANFAGFKANNARFTASSAAQNAPTIQF
jgi:LemA protein